MGLFRVLGLGLELLLWVLPFWLAKPLDRKCALRSKESALPETVPDFLLSPLPVETYFRLLLVGGLDWPWLWWVGRWETRPLPLSHQSKPPIRRKLSIEGGANVGTPWVEEGSLRLAFMDQGLTLGTHPLDLFEAFEDRPASGQVPD